MYLDVYACFYHAKEMFIKTQKPFLHYLDVYLVFAKIFHHARFGIEQRDVMHQSECILAYEGIISPRDITMESYSNFKSYKRKNEFYLILHDFSKGFICQ